MSTINSLPAHILLIHAIVVLIPLCSLILVACAIWPRVSAKLSGLNVILAIIALILVPITQDAGEWLEQHLARTALLRDHTQLGDTAAAAAIPLAVAALLIWWRSREWERLEQPESKMWPPMPARSFLAPRSSVVSIVAIVIAVLVAVGAIWDIYLIGDSGARASWQGRVSTTEQSPPHR